MKKHSIKIEITHSNASDIIKALKAISEDVDIVILSVDSVGGTIGQSIIDLEQIKKVY